MEALVGGLIVVSIVQFGLLWYRVGRVEQKMDNHCKQHQGGDNN